MAEDRRRADYRAGIIAATFANASRDVKKHPQPFRPSHFFPGLAEHRPPQPAQDQRATPEMLEAVFGGAEV